VKHYAINEIFYSLQGEGVRAGTPNVFVRFAGCNLACDDEPSERSPGGFKCDTEFVTGRVMTGAEIVAEVERLWPKGIDDVWVILTGGEPTLQLDAELVGALHEAGISCAVETNGTRPVCRNAPGTYYMPDWITVSPKVAEHAIEQRQADEVKYVRGYGQGIPRTVVEAKHKLISPAFDGGEVKRETLEWCIKLCLDNPPWRLSVQQHKLWTVR
jgi:organic radical activating enzyme